MMQFIINKGTDTEKSAYLTVILKLDLVSRENPENEATSKKERVVTKEWHNKIEVLTVGQSWLQCIKVGESSVRFKDGMTNNWR